MLDKKTKTNPKKSSLEEEKLRQEIDQLKKEVLDFKNKYLRALADYQNLENRTISDREEAIKSGNRYLILKLLPFLDNLEKAEIFVKDAGLSLAKNQIEKVLKESGLEEIDVLNKEYDPYTAEVVEMVESDKDNMVVAVLRKGYRMNDKILRVAQVKVGKKTS